MLSPATHAAGTPLLSFLSSSPLLSSLLSPLFSLLPSLFSLLSPLSSLLSSCFDLCPSQVLTGMGAMEELISMEDYVGAMEVVTGTRDIYLAHLTEVRA